MAQFWKISYKIQNEYFDKYISEYGNAFYLIKKSNKLQIIQSGSNRI